MPKKARAFQLGSFLNDIGEYSVINEQARIITRVAVVEGAPGISIKVAKGEPPQPLTTEELSLFSSYMEKVKFAGVWVNYINLPPDILVGSMEVFYRGTLEEETKKAVSVAIQDYLNELSFNGRFVVNDCIAAIRQVLGVVNVKINSFSANSNPIDVDYEALSGYFLFDGDNSNFVMTLV